jgi:phospholipase C
VRARALIVAAVAAAGATAAAIWASSGAPNASALGTPSPIRHVVIIFQENHSFDNALGKLCADIASGLITDHDPCDGATSGRLATGDEIDLTRASDIVPYTIHSVQSQSTAIDNGQMDGFSLIGGCRASDGYACYSQFDADQIPNLWLLASTFVISDRTFEFARTPSWGGHMVLASGTLDGFLGDIPKRSRVPPGPGWGCDSNLDAKWWNGSSFELVPSCVPDQNGNGPYRPSPVRYVPTIFDRLDAAGASWKIYGGAYAFTICPTFYECLGSAQRTNLVKVKAVVSAAANGRLPSFAIVTPAGGNSQHNGQSMAVGDNWIGDVVSAIENGPDWVSTAIFITYDDCGCFYDHVPPPSGPTGIREPLVIVSPYARAGFTDSNTATFISLLAYTEHTFGLQPLNSDDAQAYDFSQSFDYSQTPLPPVAMTRTAIPDRERAWLRAHPLDPDDPT